MKSIRCMAVALVFLMVMIQPLEAWDIEHDVVAQLTGEALPGELGGFFSFSDFGVLIANCHYPDMTEWEPRRYRNLEEIERQVGKEDRRLLESCGCKNGGWFHRERGRASLLALLSRAFAKGEHTKAAFYLSVLTHSVSDESALNHPPLLQFVQYSKFEGVDYSIRKVENGAKNIFGFRSDGIVVHKVRQRLQGYQPKVPQGNFEEMVLAFVSDAVRQADVAARLEGKIAFAPLPEAEDALADLVAMQVKILVDMAWSAWVHKSPAAPLPGKSFDAACHARMDAIGKKVDPGRQAIFSGIFDASQNPKHPKGIVGLICEPYAMFSRGRLSYVGRMIVASAGRTLRDNGWAVQGIALPQIGDKGLPSPKDIPLLLLSLGRGGLTQEELQAFREYRAAGGRLLVLGGADPYDLTGLKKHLIALPNEKLPVSSQWGVQNEKIWRKMSISFAPLWKELGQGPIRLTHNPNINGFCKPYSQYVFHKDAPVQPLVTLDNGEDRHTIAARSDRVLWMPEYLLMPFVFSQDKTADWNAMRLDSFGTKVLLRAVESLRK